MRDGEGGLAALQFFGYLKRLLELLIFERTFLLIKNMRNLRINLRNKLLYSYIFIMCTRGFFTLVNTSLFTLNRRFCADSLRMTLNQKGRRINS